MLPVVCTLFEGHYHYGVAVLVNSLQKNGYNGCVYVGYKGVLPKWAITSKKNPALGWPGATTLVIAGGLQLHFLPVDTSNHLTNYKPDFMLRILDGPGKNAEAAFYFDPDIVVVSGWSFFEDWVSCGIALCEDINSPLACNHPRRVLWRNYFGKHDITLKFKNSIYVNGGFVGLLKSQYGFLQQWKTIQETMAPLIGGLGQSIFSARRPQQGNQEPFDAFSRTDQDALNAAVEAWHDEFSFIGKEGMAFSQGTSIIPHALGSPKPWKSKIMLKALAGYPPGVVDHSYWRFVNAGIKTHTPAHLTLKIAAIKVAALIGRFYRRGNS